MLLTLRAMPVSLYITYDMRVADIADALLPAATA